MEEAQRWDWILNFTVRCPSRHIPPRLQIKITGVLLCSEEAGDQDEEELHVAGAGGLITLSTHGCRGGPGAGSHQTVFTFSPRDKQNQTSSQWHGVPCPCLWFCSTTDGAPASAMLFFYKRWKWWLYMKARFIYIDNKQSDHMLTKWETSDRKFFFTSPFIRFIDSLEEKSGLLT